MIMMSVPKILAVLPEDVFTLIFPHSVLLLINAMRPIVMNMMDAYLLIILTDVGMKISVMIILVI